MKYLLIILSIVTFNSLASNLCDDGEEVEFSCNFNTKTVSVCSNDDKRIYRFGKNTEIELELTSIDAIEHFGFSGGGGREITFFNGSYSYVINSRTVRTEYIVGGWQVETIANLTVSKKDEILAQLDCIDIFD